MSGRAGRHLLGGMVCGIVAVAGTILTGGFGPQFQNFSLYVVIAVVIAAFAGLIFGVLTGLSIHRLLPDLSDRETEACADTGPAQQPTFSLCRMVMVLLLHAGVIFLCYSFAVGYFERGDIWGVCYAAAVGVVSVSLLLLFDGLRLS